MTDEYPDAILIDFPVSIHGRTVVNEDGSYSIFINAKLNHEMRLKAYEHEIEHIKNGDFEKNNVQNIESVAHNLFVSVPRKKTESLLTSEERAKRIRRIQRKRKKIQKQLAEREKAVNFIQAYLTEDYFFQQAEYRKLHGNDM